MLYIMLNEGIFMFFCFIVNVNEIDLLRILKKKKNFSLRNCVLDVI